MCHTRTVESHEPEMTRGGGGFDDDDEEKEDENGEVAVDEARHETASSCALSVASTRPFSTE